MADYTMAALPTPPPPTMPLFICFRTHTHTASLTAMAFYFHSFIMMIHSISADILCEDLAVCRSLLRTLAACSLCGCFWQSQLKHRGERFETKESIHCRFNLSHLSFSLFVQYWTKTKPRWTNPFVISSWLCVRRLETWDIVHKLLFPS